MNIFVYSNMFCIIFFIRIYSDIFCIFIIIITFITFITVSQSVNKWLTSLLRASCDTKYRFVNAYTIFVTLIRFLVICTSLCIYWSTCVYPAYAMHVSQVRTAFAKFYAFKTPGLKEDQRILWRNQIHRSKSKYKLRN